MFERFAPYGSSELAALRARRDFVLASLTLIGAIVIAFSLAAS